MCSIESNALSLRIVHRNNSFSQGGQNVNKVNTKAQLRFHVPSAAWIPCDVRARFTEQQRHRINGEGEIMITSQEQRYSFIECVGLCSVRLSFSLPQVASTKQS